MNQRDVYDVNFLFPDGRLLPHPVIVLSIPKVLDCEGTFIGVPISHSAEWHDDQFSFPLYNTDFDSDLKYPSSYARMHLITVIHETSLMPPKRKLRTMKQEPFNQLFNQIQELIFGCV